MRNLILMLFLCGTSLGLTVSATQVLPEDLHCMPVLIEIPLADGINASYGTGIYLHGASKTFLVTAAHVIFNMVSTNRLELINSNATLSSFVKGKDSKDKVVVKINLKQLRDGGLIKRHPSHDVTVVCVEEMLTGSTNGSVRFIRYGFTEPPTGQFVGFLTNLCSLFNEILDGHESYILGYAVELLNKQLPSEVDFNYPLVRKGIISQKNQRTRKLIVDSGVYGGNSGGPVAVVNHVSLDRTEFKVAGLITQFVPIVTKVVPQIGVTNSYFVNSGYGVAEPIDYALELMRQ